MLNNIPFLIYLAWIYNNNFLDCSCLFYILMMKTFDNIAQLHSYMILNYVSYT